MDIALAYDSTAHAFDVRVAGGDLVQESTMFTALVLSLLTDRRAADSDALDTAADRRGWWADSFAEDDLFGSRMWLLARSKQTPGTVLQARRYCEEALAWLIEDGYAARVSVVAAAARLGWLTAAITVTLAQGGDRRLRFEWSGTQWTLAGESQDARS